MVDKEAAMCRGSMAIFIGLLGIVLLVAAYRAGAAEDPSSTMLGLAGMACFIGGGYLLYKSRRNARISGK
jgi:membrane-bound ClpP family serine protease